MSKIRTVISLEAEEKEWLDHEANRRGISMAELVRLAVRALRKSGPSSKAASFSQQLQTTQGIWPNGDGLEYQRKIRDEW